MYDYYFSFLVAFFLFFFLFLFFCKSVVISRSNLRLPPGPWKLPIIGNLHHLVLNGSVPPHRTIQILARLYGPLMTLHLGEKLTIVASSPAAAEAVMKTHDPAFADRPDRLSIQLLYDDVHGVVFAPYGDSWSKTRRICVSELLNAKRVRSFRRIRDEEMIKHMNYIAAADNPRVKSSLIIDVSERITAAVTDIAVRAIAGGMFSRQDEFLKKLTELNKFISGYEATDLFPSSRLAAFLTGTARRAKRHRAQMFELMDEVIERHLAKHKSNDGGSGGDDDDFVDVLLKGHDDGGLDVAVVKTLMLEMLSGGIESTSSTLHWAMAELMRNPAARQQATEELRQVVGRRGRVTEDDLEDLRYLKCVVKETLRLHPPGPLLPRECRRTCSVLGYDVPKGAVVLVNAFAVATDPAIWDDPEAFKPERFFAGSGGVAAADFKGTDFEFIPFGAGRRMCPGLTFSQANVEMVLACLLYHFDWELPEGMKPSDLDMAEVTGFVMRKKSDVFARAIVARAPAMPKI